MEDHDHETTGLTRRDSLRKLGGVAALALGGAAGIEVLDPRDAAGAGAGPAAVSAGLVSCVLTPEMTEGPFYLEGDKVRRDVREGRPGVPLLLETTVLDVSSCKPITAAAVDIWHCDAGARTPGSPRREPRAARSCGGSSGRTGTASRASRRSTRAGTRADRPHPRARVPGRERRPHGPAVLRGRPDGCRLPPGAVQQTSRADDPQRDRLDLPERRLEVDAAAGEAGNGYVGRITMGVARA